MIQFFTDSVSVAPAYIPQADTLSATGQEIASDITISTAEAVFGPASTLAGHDMAGEVVAAVAAPLTGNVFYDTAVLVCFVAYCLIVYYYRGYVFGIPGILRSTASTEKMVGEQSKLFGSFLTWTIALGLLMCGLTVLKVADMVAGERVAADLPQWAGGVGILVAWGAAGAVWGFQYLALKVAGGLTMLRPFTDNLFYLKKIVVAVGTIAIMPVFLFFALSDGQAAYVLGIIMAALAATLGTFLIIRTFMLFVRHNFSILVWILYLCAVEIFPVSLLMLLAVKIFG